MSEAFISLMLQSPMQSWGFDSQYNRRSTGMMPTKSAIIGMCCAAAGADRGSELEREIIDEFAKVHMTSLVIPRLIKGKDVCVRRLVDYHIVQDTRKANGKIKDSHITNREYLTDSGFGVVLCGDICFLKKLEGWLKDPVWGIWLGRKACIPSSPVFQGVFDSKGDALKKLIGNSTLESFTRQEDVEKFSDGKDSISDQPVSFDSSNRKFVPRRVNTIQGTRSLPVQDS
jgi:CRISPR system Cascade subunit CasD